MDKAPKHYLDEILDRQKTNHIPTKPVSLAYVNKMAQHFLSESLKNNEIPEPLLLQVAEMFGADNWRPQPLSWSDEVNRLAGKYPNSLSEPSIKASLQRSEHWHSTLDMASHWFESGDIAEQSFIKATQQHKENPSVSLDALATEYLMENCLERWKSIFLRTCLWMRTKEVDSHCEDLFIILHCLDNKVSPSSIPLMCNISAQTMATLFRQEMAL